MRWRDRGHTTFVHRMKLMGVVKAFDPYLSFHLRITTTARWPREAQGKRLRCFCTLDVCAKFAQFLIEMFVAAVDVINAGNFGNSVGLQSCEDQCSRRAQVARHHRCTEETINTINYRGRPLQLHLRTHALE